ncbi:hypothetical protein D3C72_1194550 [compost metagenome]
MRAQHRIPVELHQARLPAGVDEAKGMHAKALHHPVAARNATIGHHPHQHMGGLRHQRHKVPERVVGRRRLRHAVMRLGFYRVHQVRKLHRVLDEEDRHVVADQVPVAFVGIELDGKAAHVARGVLGPPLARHRGKAHEHRRALAGFGKQGRRGQVGQGLVALEVTVGGRAARVHDALGNALVIEVRNFFTQDEVFQQRRPAHARLERMLVVGNRHALVGRQRLTAAVRAHP